MVNFAEGVRLGFICRDILPGDLVHLELVPYVPDPNRTYYAMIIKGDGRDERGLLFLHEEDSLSTATAGLFVGYDQRGDPAVFMENDLLIINIDCIIVTARLYDRQHLIKTFALVPTLKLQKDSPCAQVTNGTQP